MRKCQLCQKNYNISIRRVKLRGHYNPTTKVKQKANLQWFKLPNSNKRIKICMSCRKSLLKTLK